MLIVLFAILSAVVLFAWETNHPSPAPQSTYRAESPPPAPR
jgi:hypothetical protein